MITISNKDFQNGFVIGLASCGIIGATDTSEVYTPEIPVDENGVDNSGETENASSYFINGEEE